MEAPRLTQFMGYTALTSGANEQPVWGHFMADYMDQCQERFEEWLEEYTEWLRDDMRPMDPAPWICDRWRDQRFARSSHRTEDHNLFEPRQGYIQNKGSVWLRRVGMSSEVVDSVREWRVLTDRSKILEWVKRDPFSAACALDMLQYGGVVAIDENGHIWLNGRGSGYGCYGRIKEDA